MYVHEIRPDLERRPDGALVAPQMSVEAGAGSVPREMEREAQAGSGTTLSGSWLELDDVWLDKPGLNTTGAGLDSDEWPGPVTPGPWSRYGVERTRGLG